MIAGLLESTRSESMRAVDQTLKPDCRDVGNKSVERPVNVIVGG